MKPWLKWSFAGSLGLSAWAILFPAREASNPARGALSSAALPLELHAQMGAPANFARSSAPKLVQPLPTELPQPQFEASATDPFVGPTSLAPSRTLAVTVDAPPPSSPVAPAINYRFLGRVVDPDGQTLIYLSHADKDLRVARGTQLEEGYVVEAIRPDAVLLYYAPLDFHTQIRIPPPDSPQ